MFKFIFAALFICINFVDGFSQGQPTQEGRILKTPSGFEYQWKRKSSSSQSVSVDDYVFFNMTLTVGDSILQKTHKPSVLKISADNNAYGPLKPLVDLMATLEAGDSIKFFMPLDSFKFPPPEFENLKQPLAYSVGIVRVMNASGFETYSDSLQECEEKEMQIYRDRFPQIESMMKSFWIDYMNGQKNDLMISHESGLRYLILDPGESGTKPAKGELVTVHYYGFLESNGEMFDSSFENGRSFQFPVGQGQVIPGWDIGIPLFNKGGSGVLFIPSNLAYGEGGSPPVIPSNANLIFYVEVDKPK